jgi:hypothetical protein
MIPFRKSAFKGGALLLMLLLSLLGSLSCMIWEMGKPVIDAAATETMQAAMLSVYETQKASLAQTQASVAQTQAAFEMTYQAERDAVRKTSTARANPAPPVITRISFPSEIPGNHSTIIGLVYFQDPNGDINRVTLEVVSAINFGGSDYDPMSSMDSGSLYDGAFKIYIWCEGQQDVTLRVTLYDISGLKSNSMNFSFTCKEP